MLISFLQVKLVIIIVGDDRGLVFEFFQIRTLLCQEVKRLRIYNVAQGEIMLCVYDVYKMCVCRLILCGLETLKKKGGHSLLRFQSTNILLARLLLLFLFLLLLWHPWNIIR